MKVRIFSRHALLGTSLGLMLQTSYRFVGPIGIGEILAATCFFWAFLSSVFTDGRFRVRRPDSLTLSFLAVFVLIVTPVTLFSYAMSTPGSSFRDLISYYFVCGVLLTLPHAERDVRKLVIAFLAVLFVTIGLQYFWGGSSAHYYSRFTGGAKNPNQLALYLIAAILLSAYLPSIRYRIVVVLLSLFFGLASLSDAYFIFLVVSVAGFIVLTILPPRAVLVTLPLLVLLSYVAIIYSGLADFLILQWTVADEGGSRMELYLSGFYAWVDTPFSFVFGHGAGSFSGMDGAFGLAEAHNTVLDLATVAGVFGLFLFPGYPLWIAMVSLSRNYRFAPAVFIGMVGFAFFHFVGRQPIFWVSMVVYARMIQPGWVMRKSAGTWEPTTKGTNV